MNSIRKQVQRKTKNVVNSGRGDEECMSGGSNWDQFAIIKRIAGGGERESGGRVSPRSWGLPVPTVSLPIERWQAGVRQGRAKVGSMCAEDLNVQGKVFMLHRPRAVPAVCRPPCGARARHQHRRRLRQLGPGQVVQQLGAPAGRGAATAYPPSSPSSPSCCSCCCSAPLPRAGRRLAADRVALGDEDPAGAAGERSAAARRRRAQL